MDDTKYREWIKELTNLSSTQAIDVSNRLKILNKVKQDFSGKQDFGDRTVNAIVHVMRKNNAETIGPASLRKSSAYASSSHKFADLAEFFETISPNKLVQDQILKIALELLFVDLLNWNVPVSSHTLLKQVHRLPSTLHRHFPGYVASGLLIKLVKV